MAAPSIEDRIAINDLFVTYACSLDHGDVEAVVSCFTRDGVIESPAMGKFTGEAGIREFAARNARYQKKPGVQLRHVVSNVRIDVEPDATRARAHCAIYSTF
jgi:ketosteroid isomerase-like protein